MILMIDNYDSFTYNLVHLFQELGAEVAVYRNDAITVEEAEALAPSQLVISPGPGRPADAGVSVETIYKGFGSKTGLLEAGGDFSIVGDAAHIAFAERPEFHAMG